MLPDNSTTALSAKTGRPPSFGAARNGLASRLRGFQSDFFNRRQLQIAARVFVANILDHRTEQQIVTWNFAVLHVASDQIAKHAPEILMPRIGHERARVGDHADKTREQTDIR